MTLPNEGVNAVHFLNDTMATSNRGCLKEGGLYIRGKIEVK